MCRIKTGHIGENTCCCRLRDTFLYYALACAAVFSIILASPAAADRSVLLPAPAASVGGSLQTPQPPEAVPQPARLQKKTLQIVVSVLVNRQKKGDFFVELDEDGELYMRTEDLSELKLKMSNDRVVLIEEEQHAPLRSLPGLTYTFDEKKLVVSIVGRTAEFSNTVVEILPQRPTRKDLFRPRETSAFLNYGVTYSRATPAGLESYAVSQKLGVSTGDFFLVTDGLYNKSQFLDRYVRLQSNLTYERRDDVQWLVLGDQFANSGYLGSSVNIGGISFSKVYKVDPYFITQPMFNLQGMSAFPSQARIYMDGMLVNTQSVAPGTFDLKNVYAGSGAHRVEVVLTDPFGNEQRISYPLYFTQTMLREGLHEYSYNAGFLREQYGIESNKYGKPAVSAYHRYGVTSSFNLGIQAEVHDGLLSGGLITSILIPRAGAFTFAMAGSSVRDTTGAAGLFQHSYQLGSFSSSVVLRGYTKNFSTIGSLIQAPPTAPKYELSLSAGYSFEKLGNISLGYSETGSYGGLTTGVATGSYSTAITPTTSLFVTGTSTSSQTMKRTYGCYVGLNFDFGKGYRGSTQYGRSGTSDTQSIQIQKDQPLGEGVGHHASVTRNSTGSSTAISFNPYLQYNARYAILSADANLIQSGGTSAEAYTLSAAGSFVYAGGFIGLSRPVNDSFGIVMVERLPGVSILHNGSDMGKTDSSGTLVVPTLTSYNDNLISLDMKTVPMDNSISVVKIRTSPSLWSGSCISFEAVRTRAVTGILHATRDGKKLPLEFVDISLKVGDRVLVFPTGKGGELYIENTLPKDAKGEPRDRQSCRAIAVRRKSGADIIQPGTYQATVELPDWKCEFPVTFPDTEDFISDIGEVECVISHPAAPIRQP